MSGKGGYVYTLLKSKCRHMRHVIKKMFMELNGHASELQDWEVLVTITPKKCHQAMLSVRRRSQLCAQSVRLNIYVKVRISVLGIEWGTRLLFTDPFCALIFVCCWGLGALFLRNDDCCCHLKPYGETLLRLSRKELCFLSKFSVVFYMRCS